MTANERLRFVREELSLSQAEFGEIIGLSRSGVSEIEAGRRNVTEKHIKMLTIQPVDGKYINEEWLRSGEGTPFKKLSKEEEIASYVEDLLSDGTENPLYEIILEIMRTYSELTPKSQEVLRDFSRRLLDNMRKEED